MSEHIERIKAKEKLAEARRLYSSEDRRIGQAVHHLVEMMRLHPLTRAEELARDEQKG